MHRLQKSRAFKECLCWSLQRAALFMPSLLIGVPFLVSKSTQQRATRVKHQMGERNVSLARATEKEHLSRVYTETVKCSRQHEGEA